MIEIKRIIKRKKMKQAEVAEILGIPQSKVSILLNDRASGFSTDRLLRFLNALDQDVDITIKPKPKNRERAQTVVSFPRQHEPIAARGC